MRRTAFAFLLIALAGSAHAEDPHVNLKVSIWLPPAQPIVGAVKEWAADIEKASGGTIQSTIYPSEQLGKAFDHYDMVRDGIADVGLINPGYQPGRFPIEAIADMPMLISDAVKGTHALDSWYRAYAPTEMKDTHFCMLFMHDPGTFHSRKKILVPEDIRGLKVRPAQSQVARLVTSLGGTNVQASASGARDLLERGTADTMTFPWGSILLFGIDRVVKYHLDIPVYSGALMLAVNKDKYNAMTPAQKAVMDDHCSTDWGVKISKAWTDFEYAGRAKIKAMADQEVDEITPAQFDLWKRAAEPIRAKWADEVKAAGGDPVAAMKDLSTRLQETGAGL